MLKNKKRFIYYAVVGLIIGTLLGFIFPEPKSGELNPFFHYLVTVTITMLVWEGNLKIDMYMDKNFPWLKSPAKRILLHLPVSLIYSSFTIYIMLFFYDTYVCTMPQSIRSILTTTSIIMGLLVTIIILSIEIGTQFFYRWKASLVEMEQYKTETMRAHLQNLKEQVNPHFLFNNLSVLSSLVYKDQDKAADFINQLSKVYRYLLDTRSSELITLDDELNFIKSYTYLLKIRFDRNINFQFIIAETSKQLMLPPLALQLVIENAIKHNEVSSELPLNVIIVSNEDSIEVKNNLQLRSNVEETTKTGLNNIRQRYKFYTNRSVEIIHDEKNFTVKMPLLQKI